jgi:hypothetical protein
MLHINAADLNNVCKFINKLYIIDGYVHSIWSTVGLGVFMKLYIDELMTVLLHTGGDK